MGEIFRIFEPPTTHPQITGSGIIWNLMPTYPIRSWYKCEPQQQISITRTDEWLLWASCLACAGVSRKSNETELYLYHKIQLTELSGGTVGILGIHNVVTTTGIIIQK